MAYTTNEKLPEIRMKAVLLLRKGWSSRKVARHLGYTQSAIVKWAKRAPRDGRHTIPTRSSAPKNCPKALSEKTVERILTARAESKRCAEVVYRMLKEEGVRVSLSSVRRKLDQHNALARRSPWKKTVRYPPKPAPVKPGALVQIDTIHFMDGAGKRSYLYTAIDVHSRYAFACGAARSCCSASAAFLKKAVGYFPFKLETVQTDNGSEFGRYFTRALNRHGIAHRHNHPRTPTGNAHVERFNRTIQEEIGRRGLCIFVPKDVREFLGHYNANRMHMGIDFQTPTKLVSAALKRGRWSGSRESPKTRAKEPRSSAKLLPSVNGV